MAVLCVYFDKMFTASYVQNVDLCKLEKLLFQHSAEKDL